jgi:aminoglycoside phosphotransferase family enzyme/predicted kinase
VVGRSEAALIRPDDGREEEAALGDLVRDLEADSEQLIETHISWVFLRAQEVFKVKKPVNFGFLDFSSLEARRSACHAELVLNSRLAAGVYIDVVPITRDARGTFAIGGDGVVVDYAVHMKRLPVDARADLRLARGDLEPEQLDALAQLLARFHARSEPTARIAEFGRIEVIRENVEENFAQAGSLLSQLAPEGVEREVEARQLAFLRARAPLFDERVRAGKIRDGHGDLRLEHVYMVDGAEPVIIDCIEFNERFRYADVCADIAFLSMDLGWHGRADYKERFLAAYARASGDDDLFALVDFYESYRAYVRAKVCALSLAGALAFDARTALEAQARRYLLFAQAAEREPLEAPRLIAVGGLIASGKSSLADAVGKRLGAPVISSDVVRKRSLGVEPTARLEHAAWQGAYSPGKHRDVYAELLRRAGVVLESGRSVIIDATFRRRADREAARNLALARGVGFCFIECRSSDAVARARLEARARGPSESDARLEIYDELVASQEAVTELAAGEHLPIDTSGTLSQSLAALARAGVIADEASD